MKVVYPKHIQKGMMAGMSFTIGPITLSIVQLFIMGVGVGGAVGAFNTFSKSGAKAVGIILAIVILLIAAFIAFFKMSELNLLGFVSKMIRNNFFDTNKKYQVNYGKFNPIEILIKKSKTEDKSQTVFEIKDKKFAKEKIEQIEKGGLI